MGLGRWLLHCKTKVLLSVQMFLVFSASIVDFNGNSLIPDIEPRPHFICVVAGGFPRAQEPLQFRHGQGRRDALAVLSVRRPGAAPGPGEPGHKRHFY